jgi:hypothetical protein
MRVPRQLVAQEVPLRPLIEGAPMGNQVGNGLAGDPFEVNSTA